MFHDDLRQELLSSSMREMSGPTSVFFAEQLNRCDAKESLDRMLHVDCNLWLPDYLLLRETN